MTAAAWWSGLPCWPFASQLGNATESADIVAAYTADPERPIPADGQSVAMARSNRPGDTAFETVTLRFTGDPGPRGEPRPRTPHLADVRHRRARRCATSPPSSDPVTVSYAERLPDAPASRVRTPRRRCCSR